MAPDPNRPSHNRERYRVDADFRERLKHYNNVKNWLRNGLSEMDINIALMNYPDDNRCEICKRGPKIFGHRLVMDHCHKTKRFRGWLCHRCNLSIGSFKDDPKVIERVIAYLRDGK